MEKDCSLVSLFLNICLTNIIHGAIVTTTVVTRNIGAFLVNNTIYYEGKNQRSEKECRNLSLKNYKNLG